MAKTEKKILEAQAWRKKHPEAADQATLTKALTQWEETKKKEQALKTNLKAAKDEGESAVKAVAKALKESKAVRKQPKEPQVKKVKEIQP
jgi:hypothetical protein